VHEAEAREHGIEPEHHVERVGELRKVRRYGLCGRIKKKAERQKDDREARDKENFEK
jgi:hypothetical protein